MAYAFHSQLLNFRRYKRPPVWQTPDGRVKEVSFILEEMTPFNCNFVTYNMTKYPDLKYVGQVDGVITSGILKGKPLPNFQEMN